jgi:hypothetical protein
MGEAIVLILMGAYLWLFLYNPENRKMFFMKYNLDWDSILFGKLEADVIKKANLIA